MSKPQTTSPQSLTRGNSFINRTPHTVIVISQKNTWQQILEGICRNLSSKNNNLVSPKDKNTIKCLKIQECHLQANNSNGQCLTGHISTNCNKCHLFNIPPILQVTLIKNLTKLVITKCGLSSIQFMIGQTSEGANYNCLSLFPNLQQFDGSSNNLIQVPQFLFTCSQINKINLDDNQICILPNKLCKLQKLKYIRIYSNHLLQIGKELYIAYQNKDKIIEFQWELSLLQRSQRSSVQSISSIYSNGTHRETNQQQKQKQEDLILQPNQNINLRQYIKQIMKNNNNQSIQNQIQIFIRCQNTVYLSYLQSFITKQKCLQKIEACFKNRKYISLNFLLTSYQNIVNQQRDVKTFLTSRDNNILTALASPRPSSQIVCKNLFKFEKQNIVKDKRTKMLILKTKRQKLVQKQKCFQQKILKQINGITKSDKTSRTVTKYATLSKIPNQINFRLQSPSFRSNYSKQSKQLIIKSTGLNQFNSTRGTQHEYIIDNQIKVRQTTQIPCTQSHTNTDELLLHKLITYELKFLQSIPNQMLKLVSCDQFIWLLNQLQYINKFKTENYIKTTFSSMQFSVITNNIINTENSLQNILNSVTYKKSIKFMLTQTHIKFLESYNFNSISVLKSILNLDDFQVFCQMQKTYSNFSSALFKNRLATSQLQLMQQKWSQFSNRSNQTKSTKGFQQNQGISWKLLINPKFKIYKYVYKQHKKYTQHQLYENHFKNWHFPEYTVPQFQAIKNHEYENNETIKKYQQFQTSVDKQKLKFSFSQTNLQKNENSYSISKKIYMKVLDEVKISIKNLGKAKEKQKKQQKYDIINYSLIQRGNNSIKKNSSLRKIRVFKSQKPSPEKNNNCNKKIIKVAQSIPTSNEKLNNAYDISKRSSIKLISHQKTRGYISINKDKKKHGISVCSSSVSSIKQKNQSTTNRMEKTGQKVIYIDLSQKHRSGSILNNKKQLQISPYQELNNCSSNNKKYYLTNKNNNIHCSTFDQLS